MSETYLYNGEDIEVNQLILKIRNGEEELFSLITAEYLPVINKFVSLIDCSDADKDDFVQVGLLALCGAIDAYDFKSSSFSTFASLCIKRAILSELRHISSKKHIPKTALINIDDNVLIDDNNPESTFLDKENITDLTDKIKLSLSSFEYKVLTAYLKYGSYSETATALCVSSKDVNNALHRARKKIKKSIGSYR